MAGPHSFGRTVVNFLIQSLDSILYQVFIVFVTQFMRCEPVFSKQSAFQMTF